MSQKFVQFRRRVLVMKHINVGAVLILLAAATVASPATGQTGDTAPSPSPEAKTHKVQPAQGAYIVKYYVAKAAPGSTYETGPLHIVYSDGTQIVEDLPRKQKSTDRNIVDNQEGISDLQLAEDRQTMGWTENYDNCCTSYAVPLVLVLFRSGSVMQRIAPGQMIWRWMFRDSGKLVAVVSGPTHGPLGDFKLYDVRTGRILSEAYDDEELQALKPDAPTWAKELEARMGQSGESEDSESKDVSCPPPGTGPGGTTPFDRCKYLWFRGRGILAPLTLSAPDPKYPELARQARITGTVVLAVAINEKGTVDAVKVARSLGPGFDHNAIAAVKTWGFAPAMKDGNPVAVQMTVEITFKPD